MTISSTPSNLEIRLLGPYEIRRQGEPLPRFRSQMGQWLLALLLLRHPHPVERSWLAATLWPDSSHEQALYNLRRNLTDLRHVLGDENSRLLAPTPRTLALDLSNIFCDLLFFDQRIGSKDESICHQALAVYRGPLMEGCNEEWVLQERTIRAQAYLDSLERLAALASARQDYTGTIALLRRVISTEPFRETAQCALMKALADSGDTAGMIQVYRHFRLILHEELNAQPDAATIALYRMLKSEASIRTPLPPATLISPPHLHHRLPTPLTTFVGRRAEIQAIERWMASSRLLTLVGTGGVGKTRLALAVAAEIAPNYREGVFFLDLAPLEEPAGILPSLARVLEVSEERNCPLLETIATSLKERSLLLILDNCEHLTDACATIVHTLLERCPHLCLLVTSRHRLGIGEERVWNVPPLSLPDMTAQDWAASKEAQNILMESEAVQLYLDRALMVSPNFWLTRENSLSVAALCHQVEGLPLALELAAAWVRILPVAETVVRLRERLDLLQANQPGMPLRQQTMRATLDGSYELLTTEEQSLLRRLSVFSGGWSLEASEIVCSDAGEGRETFLLRLAALADHSLVAYEERESAARYRLLETTRQYAREKLRESGEEAAILTRHRDYFLALAEEASQKLGSSEQRSWLDRLDREHDNLRAALLWCTSAKEQAEMGLRLASALVRFWSLRGYYHEGRTHLNSVLSHEGAQEGTQARAQALHGAGVLAYRQSDHAVAHAMYEESLAIFRKLGDRRGIAAALSNLGYIALGQSDYSQARALGEESLLIFRDLEDKQGITNTLTSLGGIAYFQRDYPAARAFLEESLAVDRELGDKSSIASSLSNLGLLAYDEKDYPSAYALYEESLSVRRELGDKKGIALSLLNLGNMARAEGNYTRARACYEEGLAIERELGDKKGTAALLGSLGVVARMEQDYTRAHSCYQESLLLCRDRGQERRCHRAGVVRLPL